MRKTLAAILVEQNKDLALEQVSIPDLNHGQVLVDIDYTGICRTQLNEIQGLKGPDKYIPHTLGHEGAGTVLEVGEGVTKVKVGDKVVITWIKASGIDSGGGKYIRSDGSIINSGPVSTFMNTAVISENRLVVIPKDFSSKLASLLGCAVPTGAGIVLNSTDINAESSVAIFGLGGIGMSALLAAKMQKAKNIIAIDTSEQKLKKAKEIGATYTINIQKEDSLKKIYEYTAQQGVDYAIEAVGKVGPMEKAFSSVKNFGGVAVLAGNPKVGNLISIDPFDLIKGKNITGSWGGNTNPDRDFNFYINSYLKNNLALDKLISDVFPFTKINEAIKCLSDGAIARVLVDMKNL